MGFFKIFLIASNIDFVSSYPNKLFKYYNNYQYNH